MPSRQKWGTRSQPCIALGRPFNIGIQPPNTSIEPRKNRLSAAAARKPHQPCEQGNICLLQTFSAVPGLSHFKVVQKVLNCLYCLPKTFAGIAPDQRNAPSHLAVQWVCLDPGLLLPASHTSSLTAPKRAGSGKKKRMRLSLAWS